MQMNIRSSRTTVMAFEHMRRIEAATNLVYWTALAAAADNDPKTPDAMRDSILAGHDAAERTVALFGDDDL